jgi:branched-chain amino acid transport system substrate-binding protein
MKLANNLLAAAAIAVSSEALLLGVAEKSTVSAVKAVQLASKGLPLYGLSVLNSAATSISLGDDTRGVAMSQVVPLPSNTAPVVRDFRRAWSAAGSSLEPSHLALEG